MKTPEEKIAKRRADMPKLYRGIYDKAMTTPSKAAAIHAFCLECMGWVRYEVKMCTSPACPLFNHRPYRDSSEADYEPLDDVETTNDENG